MKQPVRGSRGDGSEQRFLQVMDYIAPSLPLLTNVSKSLQNLHSEFSRALLQIFVDVYGQYSDGNMKFGNASDDETVRFHYHCDDEATYEKMEEFIDLFTDHDN